LKKYTKKVVMLLAKPYAIDTRVKNEAESLTRSGYEVTVLAWDRFGGQPRFEVRNGVKVRTFQLIRGESFSKIVYFLSALLLQIYSVGWCLKNAGERYFIHANDFNTLPAAVTLRLLQPKNVKVVYDCHEFTPCAYAEWYGVGIGLVAGALEKSLVRHVDAITTVSPPIASYLEKSSEIGVSVIYNTISRTSIPPNDKGWWRAKLDLKGFVVSYIGMLRQDVALEEFVEAAAQMNSKGDRISFIIVGYGPDLARIQEKSEKLGNPVKFVPKVPHEIALGYVKASDVSYAVYKSLLPPGIQDAATRRMIEGNTSVAMPWKLFEAMACGTSILLREGTYAWGFARTIGFGLSAGKGDATGIVAGVQQAFENQSMMSQDGRLAIEAFKQEYNWEAMSEILVSVYDHLELRKHSAH
jgi:glycosyltransferase involved in cell wall biosynthesis